MKRNVCLVLLINFICCIKLTAQNPERPMIDQWSGSLLYTFQHEDISGSPLLRENWDQASAVSQNGYLYKNLKLMFDAYNNKFIWNRNDTSFQLTPEIATVYLYTDTKDTSRKMVFKKGYNVSAKVNGSKYMQVLTEGKITLLKYYYKELEEYSDYGNAAKLKRFKDMEQYYVLQNGQVTPVLLSTKNLQSTMGDQWPAMESYMKSKSIAGKSEKDWVSVIGYFNTL